MARPSRCRRVCSEPDYESFIPSGISPNENVVLSVDEYEVIRLIDLEKMTHEECSSVMNISRTTVTEIYEAAREKIADSIVNGKALHIHGGNYCICDGSAFRYCRKKCRKHSNANIAPKKGNDLMRIAVTYENGNIFQHFGHTAQFKLYDVENGTVTACQIVDTNGQGHGALSGFLRSADVDVLICGGIGEGAQNALAKVGIKLMGGVSGSADEAVKSYLDGTLSFDPNVHCEHHEHHGEGHSCGENKHGCSGGCK